MPLDGTAWTAQFAGLAEYLRGESPLELTPVGGGDAVPFNHQGVYREVDHDDGRRRVIVRLEVTTTTALALGSSYTYDGHTWECLEQERDHVGAGAGPRHYTLVRHAS